MKSVKEPITELRAATLLIASVVDKVRKEWPGIKESLADMHGDKFAIEDENRHRMWA
jgi:hypothetical protein